MNEQLVGYIGSIVAGLITNGIQGIYNYITKETLQDRIACVIESVQKLYEQEYGYRDDDMRQRKYIFSGMRSFVWYFKGKGGNPD